MKITKLNLLFLIMTMISSSAFAVTWQQPTLSPSQIEELSKAAQKAKAALESLQEATRSAAEGVKANLEVAYQKAKDALEKLRALPNPLVKAAMSGDWVTVRALLAQTPKPSLAILIAAKEGAEAERDYEMSRPDIFAPVIAAFDKIILDLDQAINK